MKFVLLFMAVAFSYTCKESLSWNAQKLPFSALFVEEVANDKIIAYLPFEADRNVPCQKLCLKESLTCSGAKETTVRWKKEKLSIELLKKELNDMYSTAFDSLSIKSTVDHIYKPVGLNWNLRKPTFRFAQGKKTVWVDFTKNGKRVHALRIPMFFEAYDSVWVSKKALTRRSVLHKNDLSLELQKAKLSYLKNKDLAGLNLQRTIHAETILEKKHVVFPKLVSKNSPVIIYSQGLGIHAKGYSLSRGDLGDKVWVKHSLARAKLQARVIGKGKVEVLQ